MSLSLISPFSLAQDLAGVVHDRVSVMFPVSEFWGIVAEDAGKSA
jgi:hypothetical protein